MKLNVLMAIRPVEIMGMSIWEGWAFFCVCGDYDDAMLHEQRQNTPDYVTPLHRLGVAAHSSFRQGSGLSQRFKKNSPGQLAQRKEPLHCRELWRGARERHRERGKERQPKSLQRRNIRRHR